MGSIKVGQQNYSFEAIRGGDWKGLDSEFEKVFAFCRDWLRGEGEFVLRTSGSTGRPQEITVSREQMRLSANATRGFFNLQHGCRMLCCLNTEMIAGRMMLVRAMEWEAELLLVTPTSLPLENLDNPYFDFVAMVPMQLQASMDKQKSRHLLDNIRVLIIGGAPLSDVLREKAKSLKGEVYQTYGMTETVSHVALANLKAEGPLVYRALPGVNLEVDGENRLVIQAPMAGNRTLQTQDVVDLLSHNSFVWKGRVDFVVNSGGIKIHPEETESVIRPLMHEYFPERRYFLTGMQDELLGEALVLVVEGEEDITNAGHFLEKSAEMLGRFHVPKQVFFVRKFSMTPSQKINRLETKKNLR
ncbi:AMP-binding protein [Negadavirga shengliensis]|uniref:AMP-binding protein n=1 Tax=Negadavirga shengliensis TaxID=1389218 RepID=A0ABV9T7R8_9BACT